MVQDPTAGKIICLLSYSQVNIPPDPQQIGPKGFSVVFIPTGYIDQKIKVYQNLTSENELKLKHFRDGRHWALNYLKQL